MIMQRLLHLKIKNIPFIIDFDSRIIRWLKKSSLFVAFKSWSNFLENQIRKLPLKISKHKTMRLLILN
jgi:hypothetical protein